MLWTFLLIAFIHSPMDQASGQGESKFAIYSSDGKKKINNTFVVYSVNDTLSLECRIKQQYSNESTARPKWILPHGERSLYITRPHIIEENGKGLRLTLQDLNEEDVGIYKCTDDNDELPALINLIIKGSADCCKGVLCNNRCILERFVCDGFRDCKNGRDEYPQLCGPDPCHDKIKCANGRCIPRSWCCNGSNDNCTKKWDIMCCPKVGRGGSAQYDYNSVPDHFHNADVVFREYGDRPLNYLNNPQHYTDLNFLQTTVYAVFGCAIIFMLVVTILVVVMQCKFQMRRNWQFQLLNRQRVFGNNTYHRAMNQEVDIMGMLVDRFNQGNSNCNNLQQDRRVPGDLLVTYNINNGVQIVGKPIEPPPYTEVAPNPPQVQGPPPPYHSNSTEGGNDERTGTADVAPTIENTDINADRNGSQRVQASSEPNLTNIG